jgi:predicted nucleotidyltransferase
MTKEKIIEILKQQRPYLTSQFGVKRIGLFGSYLSRKHRKKSDIDILIEFEKPIGFFGFLELEEYLKKLLKIDVDLVSKKALKPNIGKYILKEVIYI